jgi:hypothetical protein
MLSVDIYIKDSVYTLLNNLLKREQFTLSATPLLACVGLQRLNDASMFRLVRLRDMETSSGSKEL